MTWSFDSSTQKETPHRGRTGAAFDSLVALCLGIVLSLTAYPKRRVEGNRILPNLFFFRILQRDPVDRVFGKP